MWYLATKVKEVISISGHIVVGKTKATNFVAEVIGGAPIHVDEIQDEIFSLYPSFFESVYHTKPKDTKDARVIRRQGTAEQERIYLEIIKPQVIKLLNECVINNSGNGKRSIVDWVRSAETGLWFPDTSILIDSPQELRIEQYNKRHRFNDLNIARDILLKRDQTHQDAVNKASNAKYKITNLFTDNFEKQLLDVCQDITN